ncbi:MAG: hypothetical protein QXN16_02650 [Candidatus Micrarchaeaceae archaeon]
MEKYILEAEEECRKTAKHVVFYIGKLLEKRLPQPKIVFVKDFTNEDIEGFGIKGAYDKDKPNQITINLMACGSHANIVGTTAHETFHYIDKKIHGDITFPYEAGAYFTEYNFLTEKEEGIEKISNMLHGLLSYFTADNANIEAAHTFMKALNELKPAYIEKIKGNKEDNIEELITQAYKEADKSRFGCPWHFVERMTAIAIFFSKNLNVEDTQMAFIESKEDIKKNLAKAIENDAALTQYIDAIYNKTEGASNMLASIYSKNFLRK